MANYTPLTRGHYGLYRVESYETNPRTLRFKFNLKGTKDNVQVGDTIELFNLPAGHVLTNLTVKTTTNVDIEAKFKLGILAGDIGDVHEGTASDDLDRTPTTNIEFDDQEAKNGLTLTAANLLKLLFDVDDDKDRAVGLICTEETDTTAADRETETAMIVFAEYHNAEYLAVAT